MKAGSFGDVASTSFFPVPLGCYGDGGAIFTNDEELANKMKSIRVHGSGSDKYENVAWLNGRLDTFQAAILLEKLSIFDDELELRNKVADYYLNNIISNVITPFIPKIILPLGHNFHYYQILKYERSKIMSSLNKENIPSMIYYKLPLHLQKVMFRLSKGRFPNFRKYQIKYSHPNASLP